MSTASLPQAGADTPNADRWRRARAATAARPIWVRRELENEPGGHIELAGWKAVRDLDAETQLLACPVCAAVVFDDGASGLLDRHEEWHARTDCPIPAELDD